MIYYDQSVLVIRITTFGVTFVVKPLNPRIRRYVLLAITGRLLLLLRLHLLHLRYDFICAIEDPTGGRSAGRALRRLCKSLDCARRAEVVTTSSDDRVCEGVASDETGEWNVVVGRIIV